MVRADLEAVSKAAGRATPAPSPEFAAAAAPVADRSE